MRVCSLYLEGLLVFISLFYLETCKGIIVADQNQPKPAYTSGIKTSSWKMKHQPTTLHNYSRVIVQNNPDAGAQYVITQTERTVKVYPVYNGHSYGPREEDVGSHHNANRTIYKRRIEYKTLEVYEKCPKGATGQFVYASSCNQFLNCWKGRGVRQNCPPGTLFNPKTLECDFPEKVQCITGSKESSFSANLRVQKSVSQPSCPKEFAGLIPNYTDCSKFVSCNNGQAIPMDCPPGTLFDTNKNVCDHPYNALCFDGRSGQVVYEYISGQSAQNQQGHHGGSASHVESQSGYLSGNRGFGYSESSYQATGVHSGVIAQGNIQPYTGTQYGGVSSNGHQNINSKLDFGEGTSACNTGDCSIGQSSNIQGYDIAGCNPTLQNCNNYASHLSTQNCNPQTQNCNVPNTRYTSSTVIRTQNVGKPNDKLGFNIPDSQGTVLGYNYGHQQVNVGYDQHSKCNPQAENCMSVNTNQGVIYIPNTGISQQGVVQTARCNPSTQNCGTVNSAQGGFYITSNVPKCSPGNQNCGTQSSSYATGYDGQPQLIQNVGSVPVNKCSPGNQNCGSQVSIHATGFNRQPVGSVPVYTSYSKSSQGASSPHVSGCGSNTNNCGVSVGQGGSYGSVSQSSTSGVQEGRYGSGQYGSGGYQYHGTTDSNLGYAHTASQVHANSQITADRKHGVIRCPDGYQGLLKHPSDCSKFLNCANGQTFVQDCAPGTLFNPNIGNCDFPYNVDCETGQRSSGGVDYGWTQTQHGFSKQTTPETTQSYVTLHSNQPHYVTSHSTASQINIERHNSKSTTPSSRNPIFGTNRGQSGLINREKNLDIDRETTGPNPIQTNNNPDYIDLFNPGDNSFGFKTNTPRSIDNQWPPPFPTDTDADYVYEYEDGEPVTIEPDNVFLAEKEKKEKIDCKKEDFYCSPTMCITKTMVCDGHRDCENGKDEQNCIEYIGRFTKIENSQLEVLEKQRWINVSATTCALLCIHTTQFNCRSFNFRRVDRTCYLSDVNIGLTGALRTYYPTDYFELKAGTVDCSDQSRYFECSNEKCIQTSQLCDGFNDCGNRQDERNCKPSDFGYSIRLAGSKEKNAGRVEITAFGQTGYICDDKFGIVEANVICRELDYELGAVEVKGQSYFAKDIKEKNTLYLMDDLGCIGNETTLLDCDFAGWGVHNCKDMEIAGVVCKTREGKCAKDRWRCSSGNECIPVHFLCDDVYDCDDDSDESPDLCEGPTEIRLVNGSSSYEGRVEIKHNGVWGTICDDDFNEDAAKVICKRLGYKGKSSVKKDSYFGAGNGPIWLDQVTCFGNETSFEDCTHWNWGEHNCDHTEDVGIICAKNDPEVPAERHSKQQPHFETEPSLPRRCGLRKDSIFLEDDLVHQRVIGGSVAKKGDYPWQAAIRVKVKDKSAHWCGAIVLSSKWVLSAAHCLQGYAKGAYVIVAGEYNIDEDEGTEQQKYIDEFFVHEDFRKGHKMNNDIALIRLKGNGFLLNDDVQAICLPDENAEYKGNCTISGFGSVKSGTSSYSHDLMATWIPIHSDEICKMPHIYGEHLTDGMFCAGFLDGGFDACDGDSGGPLACLDNGLFTVYGITSWGQHCGYANKPGVYVKVAYYRKWIEDIVNKHS